MSTSTTSPIARSWHRYQEAIFAAAVDTRGNYIVDAKAGSGKTTTLVETMRRWLEANPGKRAIFVAFNKDIATELERRVPAGAVAKTLHSVCFAAVRAAFRGVKVDDYKARDYAMQVIQTSGLPRHVHGTAAAELAKAYGLLRGTCTDITDAATCEMLLADYQLDMDLAPQWLPLLPAFGQAMAADTGRITFDEMLTHVIDHDLKMQSYDLVLVDEAQDMNCVQIRLLQRLVGTRGRIMACGDPNQACYRFRGADSAAMDKMAVAFNATAVLPLSVTYRCSRTIVQLAQGYVPAIEAAPHAAEGEVIKREGTADAIAQTIADMLPGTMVVCRANAPLVGQALKLIREGRRAVVKGRDIGKAVIKLYRDMMKRAQPGTVVDLIASVAEFCQLQADRLRAARKDTQADGLIDRGDTLIAILQASADFGDVERRCEELFSDVTNTVGAVVFSSIHKSKGLEADRVVWLFPGINAFLKGKSKNADARAQEDNLCYIAITRAKSLLIIQEQPPFRKED